MATRQVGVFIFDAVEVLDFAGPFEAFGVAGVGWDKPPLQVFTVAEQLRPVLARNGLSVNPQYSFSDCPALDILVIPGGYGTRQLVNNPTILDWLQQIAPQVEIILSVCTGSLLLAKAGLLTGLQATTHHLALDYLQALAPDTQILPGERWVDNGQIITSAGVSAGLDASLYLVGRLLGEAQAQTTARYMEYNYFSATA
ncbi:DJ-1/PfpI family protein [Candidatus Cyanaurora vandensis]|uniref:DJ-1/PfpI family protein n=1 Tax=Candidatus Cyanaurora vandensis TaxID=2714958 RepID=UPI00257E4F8B|nr:DJ-1/PfpI family protein [Candidatus Cyanaurora vandensis]